VRRIRETSVVGVLLVVVLVLATFVGCGGDDTADVGVINDGSSDVPELIKTTGPKGIIAEIGDIDVPTDMYISMLDSARGQLLEEGTDVDAPENEELLLSIKQDIIEEIIDRSIYLDYAQKNGIEPTMTDIEDAVSREIEKQAQAIGSYDLLEETLKEAGGINELRNRLRQDQIFKDKVTKEMVIADVRSKVVVTSEEAKEFYESRLLGLSQITILYDPDNHSEEDVQKAKDYTQMIRDRIDNDLTFARAAAQYSMDESGADGGVVPQLVTRGVLPDELEETAFNLEPGGVSDVIDTGSAFVILRLDYETFAWDYYFTDDGAVPKRNFEEIEDLVIAQLRTIKFYQAEQEWYDNYRDNVEIKVYLELRIPSSENSSQED